jgi:formate dehydrogenase iron-sulfur subunit
MARMKFICDAERCIECNGCVTACKNEHEVPWGVNRRRVVTLNDGVPGEKSISVACMHCSDAPCMAVCPVNCFYRTEEGVVLHDKDVCIGCGYCFYACPFGAPQFPQPAPLVCAARWTSAPSAPVAPKSTAAGRVREVRPQPPGRRQAARLCAEMCSTKACWPATATWWPTSSATACCSAAKAPKCGAGVLIPASSCRRKSWL